MEPVSGGRSPRRYSHPSSVVLVVLVVSMVLRFAVPHQLPLALTLAATFPASVTQQRHAPSPLQLTQLVVIGPYLSHL